MLSSYRLMQRGIPIVLLAGFLITCGRPGFQRAITIGAAANLAEVFPKIGQEFERQTGIHPTFSFASTAQLARQIENAAPFDVFAAADSEHVALLDRQGLLAAGSRAIYARGVLALWIPEESKAQVTSIQDLAQRDVRVIAIAKPDLAPYGQAAVEALQRLHIWGAVQPKVVYAENINMVKQYGQSNNADAVFTAYSLVLHEHGKVIRVPEELHRPINQELGIVARSKNQVDARRFVDFLLNGPGKAMLASFGYAVDNPSGSRSASSPRE